MKKAILATKVGMTQIFNEEDGVLIPVTVLQAGPCVVTQVKTVENDGYSAVQVGYVDKKEKIVTKDNSGKKSIAHRNGVTKAEKGHFDKAGVSGKRYVKEFRFENAEEYTLAQEIKADIFAAGDKIDATAVSKVKVSGRNQASQPEQRTYDSRLSSIVMLVLTVQHLIRVRYSKVRRCQDRWVTRRSLFRILK